MIIIIFFWHLCHDEFELELEFTYSSKLEISIQYRLLNANEGVCNNSKVWTYNLMPDI